MSARFSVVSSGTSLKYKVYSGAEESGVAHRLPVVVDGLFMLLLQDMLALLLNVPPQLKRARRDGPTGVKTS